MNPHSDFNLLDESDEPLVTIAIPTYNGADHLEAALDTAFAQSYPRLDILVLDDCSTDATVSVAGRMASGRSDVRIVRRSRNVGLSSNFNGCLEHAAGSWVKFLLQDDMLDPSCVELMIQARVAGCPLVVSGRRYEFHDSDSVRRAAYDKVLEASLARQAAVAGYVSPEQAAVRALAVFGTNIFGEPVATLVDKRTALFCGGFRRELRAIVDYEFYLRVATQYGLVIVPTELATFRVHSDQETARRAGSFDVTTLDLAQLAVLLASDPSYERARVASELTPADLVNQATRHVAHAWALAHHIGEPARMRWDEVLRPNPFTVDNVGSFDLAMATLRLGAGRLARRLGVDPTAVRLRIQRGKTELHAIGNRWLQRLHRSLGVG